MAASRRPVLFNTAAQKQNAPLDVQLSNQISSFHQQMPEYAPTDLVSLGQVAEQLGVQAVYLKNEGTRFGMRSFKILGASWGAFRAIIQKLNLPLDSSLDVVKSALREKPARLFTATDGNHGCAVARMACLLGISSEVHVPSCMHADTISLLKAEGAETVVSTGFYDDAVQEAYVASQENGSGVFVQDVGFVGYEDIPQWIVDGYSTMMREIDQQLDGRQPDLVVAPVGAGAFAQAVVSHFKQAGKSTAILTVEPDTSAGLYQGLIRGRHGSVQAHSPSIMAGLDCATPSSIAWPILVSGVDATLSVSDFESHQACLYLSDLGVSAGPCGAAPLAALQRLDESDKTRLGLGEDSVVVLLCTEGSRTYQVPHDVSLEDPVLLTQILVNINSANPSTGSIPGPGETEIARYIAAWLEHRDIEYHWVEPTKGRPSVVAVVRGSDPRVKSLMFNGHIDTVTVMGYDGGPLSGKIQDGKLYGRGAADMKCGVAAALVALASAKKLGLRGDVIFAGVADEEYASIGTEQVLHAGWRADAAIVSEPTDMEILRAHKGFVWLEVDIHGLAAHGSRADLGIDAITLAGFFLVEMHKHAARLQATAGDPTLGKPSIHASLIKGGEEESSYPALCTVTLERRTITGETAESVTREIRDILDRIALEVPDFRYDLRTTFSRSPFNIAADHPFTSLVRRHVGQAMGAEAKVTGGAYWTDCALLADAGMPSLLWGPRGHGLHGKEEWVEVESIKQVTEALTAIVAEFCA
ncbi:Diaminopropionate ammonia-lyase [Escovopsis weberi]|uniref:Probable succinyl-diaminopimelate desuccinylase n=1 Tax=Escovopsis weberi TaxID=150374 RepID=A0A0M8N002_ESCWE|nr:Diaminopropionate ammonia-lyase [Escovopsis weberi]